MLEDGISDPRNKALMKMFNMIGIGARGSDVPDIYAVWSSQGQKKSTVEEKYDTDYTILEISLAKNKR